MLHTLKPTTIMLGHNVSNFLDDKWQNAHVLKWNVSMFHLKFFLKEVSPLSFQCNNCIIMSCIISLSLLWNCWSLNDCLCSLYKLSHPLTQSDQYQYLSYENTIGNSIYIVHSIRNMFFISLLIRTILLKTLIPSKILLPIKLHWRYCLPILWYMTRPLWSLMTIDNLTTYYMFTIVIPLKILPIIWYMTRPLWSLMSGVSLLWLWPPWPQSSPTPLPGYIIMSSVFMDLVRSLHQASVMVGGDLKFSMSSHSDEVQTSIIESCLLKVVIFSIDGALYRFKNAEAKWNTRHVLLCSDKISFETIY